MLRPLFESWEDHGPLRAMFVITWMPVGGAETLLAELVRRMDRSRVQPELCCLKRLGPVGERLAREVPAFSGLLRHKYDVLVLPRLTRLMRRRRIDAVVTVGTGGDKMFWGRLAACAAGVPVICSALHSTGLPDRVERLNRLLAPLTDAFIAVAESHGEYLARHEGCPAHKVRVIPNGVDTQRFRPGRDGVVVRRRLGLSPESPVAGIVAALRPEKHHELFLQAARRVLRNRPDAAFLIAGDGPRRSALEQMAQRLGLEKAVRFVGTREDIPELLSAIDVFVLTSHMEANPVSILEAMACGKPVVATRVGSLAETVHHGRTGFLTSPGDAQQIAHRVLELFADRRLAVAMGRRGRDLVLRRWSSQRMVRGYEQLLVDLYRSKCRRLSTSAGRLEEAPVP
ncbi:MAG TPA: glycosyltransferase [Planctomycetes bacterium]|nr:glycosyltransferase [Planctomycetota bacterium]